MDITFKHCGSCKKAIALKQKYYACSISTCKKTAYCSMHCFDAHSPVFRHKDAWAEERLAPKELETEVRLTVSPTKPEISELDILIVASKLKDYVRIKSGMNTSASVLKRLSDMVRIHCDKAITRAHSDHRKTLMDRDFSI